MGGFLFGRIEVGRGMSEILPRKYSVAEIDEMRALVEREFPVSYSCGPFGGLMKRNPEFDASIEDRLRTYILAGLGPEDLKERVAYANHNIHRTHSHEGYL
jgi:hypothetical protein